jgi:hypothetical protein
MSDRSQTLPMPAMPRLAAAARRLPLAEPLSIPLAVIACVLVLPLVLYAAGVGAWGRIAYPAMNLLLAGYLYMRRSPWFAAHCLLVFCCVSLARRLVDEQAGFDPANPVLLTPYLCCAWTALRLLEYWAQPAPRRLAPFLALLGCIAYGAVLALADGRMVSTLVDVMKWSVGPLFALYLIAERDQGDALRRVFEPTLIVAGVAMAVYGIAQFLQPASWDVTWMRGVRDMGFESVGLPEPFAVRVFSTLNSPGSFGTFLSAAIVVALKRRPVWCLAAVLPMAVGLALCQYRSIWAMTLLAVLMVVLSPSTVLRRANVLALLLASFMLASTALAPRVSEALFTRAATFKSLHGDESLRERLIQYREFLRHDNLLLGEGLAINGQARRLDNRNAGYIDGAVIEIYTAMGVFVGTVFLLSLGVLIAELFFGAGPRDPHLYFDRAIVLTLFLQFPIGTVHVGELGFCAWSFMGLALGTRLLLADAARGARK